MQRDYDALIEISLLPTEKGGRKLPIFSGYKGAHLIREEYLTSGSIELIDGETLYPGETAIAFVNYLTPEFYPHSLWIGKTIDIQEGSQVVGTSKVIEVYNETLLKKETE